MNNLTLKRYSGIFALSIMIIALLIAVMMPSTAAGKTAVSNNQNASDQQIHKVIATPDLLDTKQDGIQLWHDYGTYALYRVTETALNNLSTAARNQIMLLNDADRLLLDAYPFNTQIDTLNIPAEMRLSRGEGPSLQLIQFVGPIKNEWLEAVSAAGATPIIYIANNGYLVWADNQSRNNLDTLAAQGEYIQFSEPYHPYFKIGNQLHAQAANDADDVIQVVIQMYNHADSAATEAVIKSLTIEEISPWSPILEFQNTSITIAAKDIDTIIQQPDVYWINLRLDRELNDEIQGQIMAGNVSGGSPSGPSYLPWLNNLGFSTDPADYPIVDVVDDGIGNGTTNSGDNTLHESGSIANPTRLAYVSNCTNSANGAGPDGHGHINVSIVGGYDQRSGFPFRDPLGYQRGLGINPYGRLAGTRIFDGSGFDLSSCGGTDTGLLKSSQDDGADIVTNSWGCSSCAGTYDDSSQAFDVGVRDADLTEAGNQELIIVFSAGNSGPSANTIGTPGNGKNMITVGASENDRPSDEDGSWTDGCNIGPTGADDWRDVISFSSRGPAPGSRIKPEVIAPGTHIQGTASTNGSYNGSGVCDQYRPSGQTTFASSSGTSHSTPAVAGVSSLVYWWLENTAVANTNQPNAPFGAPSPAMMKSYLIAHPTYLTGVSANDTLPSNSQGYGMPNLATMFDDTPKFLLDQTVVFDNSGETWTWTGSVVDNSKPVRIVLAYTDAAGAIGTSPQVNNLNLAATVGGSSYLGNVFSGQWSTTGGTADAANNYEAIFLPSGISGGIEITVTGFNIAGDGVPNSGDGTDQDFALVCYNCAQEPTFTLSATPDSIDICTPSDAVYSLNIGSILGYSEAVTLSTSGEPAGTTASFSVNPVTPPNTSQLTIGNTGAAAPSSYSIDITGMTINRTQIATVGLNVFTASPGTATLTNPADGAQNIPPSPTFSWTAVAQAATYTIEIATDANFSNIVDSATGLTSTSYIPGVSLNTSTTYYWRVRADNGCGTGNNSAVFSFTTLAAPGDCGPGYTPNVLLSEGFESGGAGWSHSGVNDTWMISPARPHTGSNSYFGEDIDSVSDQRLVSPDITLPNNEFPLALKFWNYQAMEDRAGGCFDGGILEISTDSGSNWIQITTGLLTDPYDGPVSTDFSSPISGQDAWCGDPQDWLNSIIDLNAYAGQTVRFRFRLATDSSVSRDGWYIDDVIVQSCVSSCSAPPPVTDLSASPNINGTGIDLSWSGSADEYEIHSKVNDPYFSSGSTLVATITNTNHTIEGDLGVPLNNHYYAIVAKSSCGATAAPSNHSGEFDFSIVTDAP